MGIRLQNSTWRRPLRTLDCWLPAAEVSTSVWRHHMQQCLRWFKLNWQNRGNQRVESATTGCPATERNSSRNTLLVTGHEKATARVRVRRGDERSERGPGRTRLVISGRMADVCAELDRLAALEAHQHLPQGS